jgi:hypothetical protein
MTSVCWTLPALPAVRQTLRTPAGRVSSKPGLGICDIVGHIGAG